VAPADVPPGAGHGHTAVLLEPTLELLRPLPGVGYRALDATLGGAGHALGLLERSAPDGELVGLDADPAAIELGQARLARFGGRVRLAQCNFRQLAELRLEPMDAIVFDLGLSSPQLDSAGRGFSFRFADEPLDMRFDPTSSGPTAAELLATLSERELADVLFQFGEEPRSRRLARVIVQRRARAPLERTGDLVAAVTQALGPARGRVHPATRTFQALRIAVNEELAALEEGLDAALELLKPGGRLAVISFHSLEDRIVKWRFRAWAEASMVTVLTRKPITPQAEEVKANPRARSAKLRAAQRTSANATLPRPDGAARRREGSPK
jgi:16S rRNA (cytosine1402-N4)-methyltransferase